MQAAAQPRDVRMGCSLRRRLCELVGVNADREHSKTRAAVTRLHHAVAHLEAEIGTDAGYKVLTIFHGLEADQIVGEHRLHEFGMIGHILHHAARWPRRVQEKPKRAFHVEATQLRAERKEMIILNPEQRVRLLKAQQRARDERIDLAVGMIIVMGYADEVTAGMQR